MKILKIFDVEKIRDEDHVHYIVKYRAKAKIQLLNKEEDFESIFEIEMNALGKEYKILHIADLHYPALEAIKKLKHALKELRL